MKNKTAIILAIIAFAFAACTKNKPEPTPEKENIILSKFLLYLDHDKPKDTIRILDGNGGYKVYSGHPTIHTMQDKEESVHMNDADESKLNVTVQGDSIIIVDRFYKKDTTIMAEYHIIDAARKSNTIVIFPIGFKGNYFLGWI